ncbi:MAG: hypothetical protein GZ093_20330 [Rhodoferax sp.]|uniref:hypothetical protein n=1 Tax=Rhodoferax sp. TaxID=50421 RepID=UPI001400C984|nr:hypothetical protein [Rhodoferax sp.]NDP41032.1 hypothetical protein [Rhodoferax sp.]
MTPLRQRMTDAMLQRGFTASTQANYVKAIYGMAKYYRRDPGVYSASDVQAHFAAHGQGEPGVWFAMIGRKFLGIQTVISGKPRFLRTVYGAILRPMRLERLSVK